MSLDLEALRKEALALCAPQFERIDTICLKNTEKVLKAYKEAQISSYQFAGTSGYGYSDMGREKLDEVFARVFKAEKALVRPHFVSGTHALATVLLSLLHTGDLMMSLVGAPYDTMQGVIGYARHTPHSLKEIGVGYEEVPLKDNSYDLSGIEQQVAAKQPKLVLIQRSRGYSTRASLTIEDLEKIIAVVRKVSPKTICFVDNCYGEFAAEREPIEAGADIIAGSLIKNPGGGIAPTGGYIAGKAELVEAAADYLTAPGLGDELGSYAAGYRLFFQGFFMAPHVTAQAIKGAVFAAAVFEKMGFRVSPAVTTPRVDLIQTIYLENEQNMCLFCQGIQGFSPVDAHVTPIPDDMPGYADKIIMAAGDFVQGSSIELSADGPIRDPYMIYLQGGIVFEHNVLAILSAAQYIAEHRKERLMIKEVLVVEGRSDVARIRAKSDRCRYDYDRRVQFKTPYAGTDSLRPMKSRGIIILTDPDRAGEQIRKFLTDRFPNAKHAFIPRKDAIANDDLGVEQASPEAIRLALSKVRCAAYEPQETFSMSDLTGAGLNGSSDASDRRAEVGAILGIGYGNAKQFLKRLNHYGVTRQEWDQAIRQIDEVK